MFAHYLGYLQYISRFLRNFKNITFKQFYLDLMDFSKNSKDSKFLKKEINETKKSISSYFNCEGGAGRIVEDVRKNFAWDFEEATAININSNKEIFYSEIKIFLKKYNLDQELVDDLIEFQKNSIIDPNIEYPVKLKTNFNFHEVIKYFAKIENKSITYQINGKNYNGDVFEWAKETLWWGRRVAACKGKIKNITNNSNIIEKASQIVETFDKR